MNILPLVSAFILIFSIGSLALLRHCKAALVESKDCTAAYRIQREIYNEISQNSFDTYKKKSNNSKEPKEKAPEAYKFPRSKMPPSQYGKLNITNLRKEKTSNPHLERTALNLIKSMYEYTSIYSKGLEEIILKILIDTAKAHPQVKSFEDLYAYIPQEHAETFYKILNGTQSYKLHTSEGYPPLRDFLIISDNKKHKPIHVVKASLPVLTAVFDEKIARRIVHEEQLKWSKNSKNKKLNKEEVENILLQEGMSLTNFEKGFLSFDTGGCKNPENIFFDKKTKKSIRW